MDEKQLSRELVPDTSMWTLALRLGSDAVDAAVFTDMEDNSLIYRHIPLQSGAPSTLRAIEDVVYENPLLLSGFRKIYIDIEPRAYMLMPVELDDPAAVAERTLPADGREWAVDTAASRNAVIAYSLPAGCTSFLRRTFGAEAVVRPSVGYLASFFTSRLQRGKHNRLLVSLRPEAVDIIAVAGSELLKAVTFPVTAPVDAAYYVMACRNELGLSADDTEIILAGDAAMRAEIMPMLRRLTTGVIPVIFPPRMFRLGREATLMPFDLTVAPLCE